MQFVWAEEELLLEVLPEIGVPLDGQQDEPCKHQQTKGSRQLWSLYRTMAENACKSVGSAKASKETRSHVLLWYGKRSHLLQTVEPYNNIPEILGYSQQPSASFLDVS